MQVLLPLILRLALLTTNRANQVDDLVPAQGTPIQVMAHPADSLSRTPHRLRPTSGEP